MSDLLKAHALANIWCEPSQDRQYTIRPARLTPRGGAFKRVRVMWSSVPLPNTDAVSDLGLYHVYQIGQIPPELLNIHTLSPTWTPMVDVIAANNLYVVAFLDNGTRIPLTACWMQLTADRNLLLAIRILQDFDLGTEPYILPNTSNVTTRPMSLNDHPLNIRFYSNARMDSEQWMAISNIDRHGIRVVESIITSHDAYSAWLYACQTIAAGYNAGDATYWSDGFVMSPPSVWLSSYIGRTFSCVYDATVNAVETYPLSDMPMFPSQLDVGRDKYLLLRDALPTMIDYYDDVEFYLVSGDTTYLGVIIPQLHDNTVRMVTHNAYAIRKDVIDGLFIAHPTLSRVTASILVVVRTGGMVRGLTHQHSRIEELYRLPRAAILRAMSDINTTVPEWHMANLEVSAYTAIMRSAAVDITSTMLETAYGYNAASLAVANPTATGIDSGGVRIVGVPPTATIPDVATGGGRRTVYGYTQGGRLLDWLNDVGGYRDIPLYAGMANTVRAEVFNYLTDTVTDGTYYDVDVVHHDLRQYGFRCYACPIIGGVPSEQWTDITDTPYYHYDPVGTLANGYTPSVVWSNYLLDYANLYTCVRIDGRMHFWTAPAATLPYSGIRRVTVTTSMNWLGGTAVRPISLNPGIIDVFQDGWSLVEGIDYYVQWPVITIVRRPATDPADTVVQVRSYGFCNPTTMRHLPARERGFVQGGILSVDHRYDIRNDRPTRIVVAGGLLDRSMVRLAEDHVGVLVTDGRPYALSDYVTGVAQYATQHVTEYYLASVDMDQRVSDYLTPLLATDTVRYPFIQTNRWAVVSPFCSAIMHALTNGFLSGGELDVPYTNTDIATWVQPWLYLLAVDPCVVEPDIHSECDTQLYHNYIIIYPHPYLAAMTLTAAQYGFVEQLIAIYLNHKTDLTPSVIIGV